MRAGEAEGQEQWILKDNFNLERNFGHGRDTLAGLLAMFNIISLLIQNACGLRCEA